MLQRPPFLWIILLILLLSFPMGLAHGQGDIVSVTPGDATRSLTPDYFCTNVNILSTPWETEQTYSQVRDLGYTRLRIPGGTVANYWDWQAGWTDAPRYASVPPRVITIADFQDGLTATATRPVIVLNMLTADLASQLDALRAARAAGMDTSLIELGNELDFPFPEEIAAYPTAADYASTAAAWIAAIRAEFPDARFAVIAASQNSGTPQPRQATWNEAVMPIAQPLDTAATLHLYAGVPLGAGVPFTAGTLTDVLSGPFARWEMVQQFDLPEIPPSMPIWVTEYNSFESEPNVRVGGTWGGALFTSTMSLLLLEEARIEIACIHVLTGNTQWSAFFYESLPPGAAQFTISAQGYALRLYGRALRAAVQAAPLAFTPTPSATNSRGDSYPTLIGWQFHNAQGGKTAFIANLSGTARTISTANLAMPDSQVETLSGDPLLTVTSPAQLTRQVGDLSATLALPPYAIALIEQRATASITLDLQGRPPAPSAAHVVTVEVQARPDGAGTPGLTTQSDVNGRVSVDGLLPGSYSLWIKGAHTLASALPITLLAGGNLIAAPELREGDAQPDNVITIADFSLLATAFGQTQGGAGYDPRADFNQDGVVSISDFALLAANFGQPGAP